MGLSTLRGRIVAVTVLLATLVVSVLVVLTQFFLARASDGDTRALARARASGVAATVRDRGGRLHVVEGATDVLDRTAWVYEPGGRLLDGSIPATLQVPATSLARAGVERYLARGGSLLYAEPLEVGGQRAVVVSTVDLTPYERSARRTLWVTLVLGAVTVLIAGVVAREVARHSLSVVHTMAERADDWQEHDLARRFAFGPPHDEIGHLGHTLDRMLDRIAAAIAAERRLTDEIAHELRTPLATIRAEAQLAELGDGTLDAVSTAVVVTAVDRLETAITTVLGAARARDLGDASCEVAVAVRPLLDGRPVRLESAEPHLAVGVSTETVSAILAPVLDNALRHARTEVVVRVAEAPDAVVVDVVDDGPGVAQDDVDHVFAAGWSGTGGHGLGLAVVARLARAAGVAVRMVPDGTGHVELRMPPV